MALFEKQEADLEGHTLHEAVSPHLYPKSNLSEIQEDLTKFQNEQSERLADEIDSRQHGMSADVRKPSQTEIYGGDAPNQEMGRDGSMYGSNTNGINGYDNR